MQITPENGYLLARRVEMPSYSRISAGVFGSKWACARVISDSVGKYVNEELVVFLEEAGIPAKMRNESGEIWNYYLVKSDYVVSTIDVE